MSVFMSMNRVYEAVMLEAAKDPSRNRWVKGQLRSLQEIVDRLTEIEHLNEDEADDLTSTIYEGETYLTEILERKRRRRSR